MIYNIKDNSGFLSGLFGERTYNPFKMKQFRITETRPVETYITINLYESKRYRRVQGRKRHYFLFI